MNDEIDISQTPPEKKSLDQTVEDLVANLVEEGHIEEVKEGLYKSIDKA